MFGERKRPEKEYFDEFEKLFEGMNVSIKHMLDSLGGEPLVYGFSFQVGPDGVPHMEHFGNVETRDREKVMEPFTSTMVDEKTNELKITAEMPGIEKKDIEVNATEDEVTIKAESEGRKYFKKIETLHRVDPDASVAKYNNGILEVSFKLKDFSKPAGKSVKIE